MSEAKHRRVILISDSKHTEVWGSLTEICKVYNLSHNYLKKKQYPFDYRGVNFRRVNFREHEVVNGKTKKIKFKDK